MKVLFSGVILSRNYEEAFIFLIVMLMFHFHYIYVCIYYIYVYILYIHTHISLESEKKNTPVNPFCQGRSTLASGTFGAGKGCGLRAGRWVSPDTLPPPGCDCIREIIPPAAHSPCCEEGEMLVSTSQLGKVDSTRATTAAVGAENTVPPFSSPPGLYRPPAQRRGAPPRLRLHFLELLSSL